MGDDRGWALTFLLAEPPRDLTRDEFERYTRDMKYAEIYYSLRGRTRFDPADTVPRGRDDFLELCGRALTAAKPPGQN